MSHDTAALMAIRSRRTVTPEGVIDAVVVIQGGTIAAVRAPDRFPPGLAVHDLGDLALMPGIVDAHVHVNEPGRTEWEGFETATRAAARGGITTIVDMPLNCIPVTTTAAALQEKIEACFPHLRVDAGFWGGVVPGNADELPGLFDAGALGAKCFLIHSGIDDFPAVSEADLRVAMPVLARHGVPLLVHAELEPAPVAAGVSPAGDPRSYDTFLASRPKSWEEAAIARMIRLCRDTGCRVHIVHLSAASALPMLRLAKAQGLPITVETCPHYLGLAAEDVPDGRTEYKCCPPIRERANADALWEGLRDGTIDQVISDHSPCTPHLKLPERGDFLDAWGGVASLQLGLSTVWTEARRRGFGLEHLAAWMARAPADLAGLPSKGRIAPGYDADLVAFDPDATWTITADAIEHRHKVTPWAGREVAGRVHTTWLRGQRIFENGRHQGYPAGRPLLRGTL